MTEITLSNGMKVYVKPTDYQADQVMMSMRAEGGPHFTEMRIFLISLS